MSELVICGEMCGDEKHCSCVPLLRREIERLRRELLSATLAQDTRDWMEDATLSSASALLCDSVNGVDTD